MLTFTGEASAGQYSIYLMAEDWIPGPRISYMLDTSPLSSVPVHLSLTGESFVKKKKRKRERNAALQFSPCKTSTVTFTSREFYLDLKPLETKLFENS